MPMGKVVAGFWVIIEQGQILKGFEDEHQAKEWAGKKKVKYVNLVQPMGGVSGVGDIFDWLDDRMKNQILDFIRFAQVSHHLHHNFRKLFAG